MKQQPKRINLEEISGNSIPDLRTAQRDAIKPIARALVTSMRSMLADGLLVIRDGKIIPNLMEANS